MNGHENTADGSASSKSENLVLVVEDDNSVRGLIAGWLSAEKISCVGAASVEAALSILKKGQVALTLLDWGLDKSGIEVLRFCREHYPLMPVIVMSGMPFDVRTDVLLSGADGFLEKPLSGSVVVAHISRWLGRMVNLPGTFLPRREEDIRPLQEIEDVYIGHIVKLLNGNVTRAAEKLGIHRQTVSAALKRLEDSGSGSERD